MKHCTFFVLTYICLLSQLFAQQDSVINLQQQLPSNDSWWQLFGDSTLTRLINTAVTHNYDLLNAIKNIEMARSKVRIERSHYFPTLEASIQYSPQKSSLGIDHSDSYSRIGQSGLSMNWEIDVFGSIRKNVKAQKEYYLASQEDYRSVMVSLAAEIATAYIQLRTYQQQLEVARHNLQSQEEILQLNEAKLKAGLTSRLTVAQARGLWLQTKATLPAIESSVYEQANLLLVLSGEYSDSLRQELLYPKPLPPNKGFLIDGIPADLMRRRPDVRAAERQMDALAAATGASRADWWPKFYLTGAFGYGNGYFEHFFKKENMTWQISPSVKWTIFSGRQIAENIRIARLQLDEGINTYNQTILTALQEVANTIYIYNKSLQQLQADRQALEQIQLTLEYAMDLYQKGLSDYQSVLDSQRNVLTYENQLVTAHSTTLLYLIQLYKALGGGYN